MSLSLETAFPKIEPLYWECFSENEIHYQCVKIDQQRGIFLLQRNLLRHKLCTQKCLTVYNIWFLYLVPLIQLVGFIMATLKVQISFICMILMMYHTSKPYKQLKLELRILLRSTCKLHLLQNFCFPYEQHKNLSNHY